MKEYQYFVKNTSPNFYFSIQRNAFSHRLPKLLCVVTDRMPQMLSVELDLYWTGKISVFLDITWPSSLPASCWTLGVLLLLFCKNEPHAAEDIWDPKPHNRPCSKLDFSPGIFSLEIMTACHRNVLLICPKYKTLLLPSLTQYSGCFTMPIKDFTMMTNQHSQRVHLTDVTLEERS